MGVGPRQQEELEPVVQGEAGRPGSAVCDSEMSEPSECELRVQPE